MRKKLDMSMKCKKTPLLKNNKMLMENDKGELPDIYFSYRMVINEGVERWF